MTIARRIHPSTSRQAYLDFSKPLVKEGKSKKVIQINGIIKCWNIKPSLNVTCMELVYFIKANNIKAFPSHNYMTIYNQLHRRMRDVEKLGWIVCLGKRPCIYKGSICFNWTAGYKTKWLEEADYIEKEEASARLDAGDKLFEGRDV